VDHRSRSPRLKYCRLLYLVGNKFNVRRNLTDNSGYIKLLDPFYCILAVFEREFERIGGWALPSDSVGRQMIYCGGLTVYAIGILLTTMTFVYLLLLIINRKLGLSSFAHKRSNPLFDGLIKSRARQAVPWNGLLTFARLCKTPCLVSATTAVWQTYFHSLPFSSYFAFWNQRRVKLYRIRLWPFKCLCQKNHH
jgi:hypothetical protein